MPIYPYRCPACQRYIEVIKPISEIDTTERCSECGEFMFREISSPPDRPFKPFFNEWLCYDKHPNGVQINSWDDLKTHMKAARVDFAGNKVGKPGCWI